MGNCIKSDIIKTITEAPETRDIAPYLLSQQIIEYTHKHRSEAMQDLEDWLDGLPDVRSDPLPEQIHTKPAREVEIEVDKDGQVHMQSRIDEAAKEMKHPAEPDADHFPD